MSSISIILPLYNKEHYISQCLDSLLSQSFRDFELIIVDDGSTDASYDICKKYSIADPRIILLRQDNHGPVHARKTGIRNASGDYIAFVDADDWVDQDYIRYLYYCAADNDSDIVICGRCDEYDHRTINHRPSLQAGRYSKHDLISKVYPSLISGGGFFTWGTSPSLCEHLFKRDLIKDYILSVDDNIRMGDDAAAVFPAILHADSLYCLDKCLYHYRMHESSLVHYSSSSVDILAERGRFSSLYHYVDRQLSRDIAIYDLRKQWLEYVLFMAIPRADVLYEGFWDLDYLFPYPQVKKGSKVVIYGMGLYGMRLYRAVTARGFLNVVGCTDRDYEHMDSFVSAPESIRDMDFDHVIITMSFYETRHKVYDYLREFVPAEKISMMDEELIFSEESLKRFGFI